MPPLFPLTLALLFTACTLALLFTAQPTEDRLRRVFVPMLLLAMLSQLGDIGWLCAHGRHPASSAREALFLAAWLIVALLSALSLRAATRSQGLLSSALLLPVVMVLDALARVVPNPAAKAGATATLVSRLATIHILSATVGTALFCAAAASGVIYLLTERRLRRPSGLLVASHNPTAPPPPSLERLDAWNHLGLVLGMLAYTAALVSGTYWLLHAPAGGQVLAQPSLSTVATQLLSHSRYVLALLTWLLYAGLLLARAALGLRGRRAARVTLLGLGLTLAVLAVYWVRDL